MNVEDTWDNFDDASQSNIGHVAVGAAILSAADAERYCEELIQFKLSDVGSAHWIKQHKIINQLNLQAHHCAKSNTDNFVLESLVTFDKVALLIHELLLVEAWRVQVFPRLKEQASKVKQGGLRLYFIHYHEVALVNLLEVILFHDYAAEAAGDAVLELIDYCSRKVAFLTATGAPQKKSNAFEGKTAKEIAAEIDELDPAKDVQQQSDDIDYRTSVVAVFILRFLTSHVGKLSVSAMQRILDTHDFVLAMVPLIENPPWVRKSRQGWEKYDNHVWGPVRPENLLTLSRCEGQPWLVLYNLLCDGECRKFYTFNTFRKDQLLRVRKYLNDTLNDQLPVLTEVQRYMDELVIMQAPPPDSSKHFIVQQIPAIRNSIIKNRNWDEEARNALNIIFAADATNDDLKELAEVFTADGVAELMGEVAPKKVHLVPQKCEISAVNEDGKSLGHWVYSLSTAGAKKAVKQDTSAGQFKRFTLTFDAGSSSAPVLPADCILQANVQCSTKGEDIQSNAKVLSVSTNMTCDASKVRRDQIDEDVMSKLGKVHWQKVGALEEGCVVQCKFQLKKSATAPASNDEIAQSMYKFSKTAFISVPSES